MLSQKLSRIVHLSKRSFSVNTPSTSTSCYIDYLFSDHILKNSAAVVDHHCHQFLSDLNVGLKNVKIIEKKIAEVRNDLRTCFPPEIRLVPIGSAANLLLANSSDLDLVLLPSANEKEWRNFMQKFTGSESFKVSYMRGIRKNLNARKIGFCQMPIFARTPILKFKSKRKLEVDIQFGNIGPIRSSLFVRTCVEFDERVSLLIHWLTKQFRNAQLLNSRIGLFSRYHVNMLVIHFLQAIPYPVLPDIIQLSPWLSTRNDWNNAVKVLSRQGSLYVPSYNDALNEQSVGGLAIQLIDYYSQIDFGKHAVDTRGRVFDRTDKESRHFALVDEYFDDYTTCRVLDAPQLLTDFFTVMKVYAKQGKYETVFKYRK